MRAPYRDDLRWLLDGSYACALGTRSAHASLVSMLEGGRTGGDPDAQAAAEERMISAVQRGNRIRDVLHRCSKKSQRVLAAAYNPEKLSSYWRELTHLLPLTGLYDRKKYGPITTGLGLRMETASATVEQKAAVVALRRAAESMLADAHAEYAAIEGESQRGRPRPLEGAE